MSLAGTILKAPIHAYRWTLKPLIGMECRHLPTCSEYALEAIDRNGPWRGFWLMLSRLSRCHPWGSHGYDPVPDIAGERHPLAPWRYGRWSWRNPGRAGDRSSS
jgi:putative membrane protein insertion efficiency factor